MENTYSDDGVIFIRLVTNMHDLSTLLEYTDHFDQFNRYRLNVFSSILNKLGWDSKPNENPLSAMLRPLVLGVAGKAGDQSVIDEARKRFKRHLAGDLIDPNIRAAVYTIVSRYGDAKAHDDLRKVSHS